MLQRPHYDITSLDEFMCLLNDTENTSEKKILNKIDSIFDNKKYNIIRYDKKELGYLMEDKINMYGIYRSLVFKDGLLKCFSPPKSVSFDSFKNKYPKIDENIIAEELVEGTMINVFWDSSIGLTGGWEIATRNVVGANMAIQSNNSFDTKKTFRTMFFEALKEVNLDLSYLSKNYCYSFVLQHPENRIVTPFKEISLYLIAMYEFVFDDNFKKILVYPYLSDEIIKDGFHNTKLKFPQIYTICSTYDEYRENFAGPNTPYYIGGIVFKNRQTLERCKIRNPNYEEIKLLRGNQPKIQYQYLVLRKEGKVKDFLKYYPEYKKEFNAYKSQVHKFTNDLLSNYISCYIKKTKPLKEYPEHFRTHMYNIHQIYLTQLKEKKEYVTNTVVINYVNNLHTNLLMYSINHNFINQNIDTQVCQESKPLFVS